MNDGPGWFHGRAKGSCQRTIAAQTTMRYVCSLSCHPGSPTRVPDSLRPQFLEVCRTLAHDSLGCGAVAARGVKAPRPLPHLPSIGSARLAMRSSASRLPFNQHLAAANRRGLVVLLLGWNVGCYKTVWAKYPRGKSTEEAPLSAPVDTRAGKEAVMSGADVVELPL
jgi:hypothetical protein